MHRKCLRGLLSESLWGGDEVQASSYSRGSMRTMAMFPLRSSCFVDAAAAAHNALELAIDDATSQVGNPTSVLGGWGTGSEPQLLRNSRRGTGS